MYEGWCWERKRTAGKNDAEWKRERKARLWENKAGNDAERGRSGKQGCGTGKKGKMAKVRKKKVREDESHLEGRG